MIEATASAKIILLGEHAVVYNQPAIAIPISSLRAYARVSPSKAGDGLTLEASDLGVVIRITADNPSPSDPIGVTATLVLDKLGCPMPDLNVQIHSEIPLASGLGSGAAISTAITRALLMALNQDLPDEDVNQIVYQVEKLYHGTPSGIDNTVIVYERPVYFVRGQPIEFLPVHGGTFHFVIANTGISSSTRLVVEDVGRLYKSDSMYYGAIFESIGKLVAEGFLALQNGNVHGLGSLMSANHEYLRQLTVSSSELDHLVKVAHQAGALGAKLSGGGRGGNMIALVSPDRLPQVKQSLVAAGAAQVFDTVLN